MPHVNAVQHDTYSLASQRCSRKRTLSLPGCILVQAGECCGEDVLPRISRFKIPEKSSDLMT